MSPEDVEIVEALRRIYGEWAQGAFSGGHEIFDPNVEGVWAAELPDAHVDQGAEALAGAR